LPVRHSQCAGSLFWCHAVLSLQFTHVRSFASRHRRSQGGLEGHVSPQIFKAYSHLCFERRYHKQNSVIRLKSNILAPPNFWAGLRYYLQGLVAKLASECFYWWSLSCNNNMATNLQMFTSSYDIGRFVACGSWTQTSRQWLLLAASRNVGEQWHWIP